MTSEQAKSELMQIYMSLSEEKKQALDVLMAQADGEYDGVYISYDLISRQAVIEAIYDMEILKYRIDLEKVIKELPSVAIPNKVGHWIKIPLYEEWKCSECDTKFRFTFKEHDYCPNCGAKMD